MNDTIGVTILREIKMADTNSTGNIKINGLFDLYSNISIGYTAGNALVLGSAQKNVLIGYKAGLLTTEGDDNIALGSNVMSSGATTGVENICIGKSAGNILTSGINNICIGSSAGNILTEGSNNVLIGQSANPSSGTLSDKLVIRNTNGTLITGDFSSKSLFFDCGTSNIVRTDNTASVTVAGSDYLVRCTYNTGAITVTLPAIVAGEARTVVIVNASASQTVTIVRTGSDTIDDGATTSLVLNNQYDRAVLISNGVASGIWYTI